MSVWGFTVHSNSKLKGKNTNSQHSLLIFYINVKEASFASVLSANLHLSRFTGVCLMRLSSASKTEPLQAAGFSERPQQLWDLRGHN